MPKADREHRQPGKREIRSVLDLIPERVIDQNALCMVEIAQARGLDPGAVERLKKEGMELGIWEQVWKKYNGRTVKAYRPKK